MIRVRIDGRRGKIGGFLIWGHAGYAQRGKDIVCAGVSAVATTAILGLTELFPGYVRATIHADGVLFCRLTDRLPDTSAGEAQAILHTMVLGLEAIREDHGNMIDISYRR